MENIIDKLRKIKELAERGIDGEAIAAQALLDSLMKKYHIDMPTLMNEEKVRVVFRYNTKRNLLFKYHLFI